MIVQLIVYGFGPLALTVYLRRNFDKFRLTTFKSQFNEVIEALSYRRVSSNNLFLVFCYRRLILVILIVLMRDFTYAQIQLQVFTTQTVIIIVGLSMPF